MSDSSIPSQDTKSTNRQCISDYCMTPKFFQDITTRVKSKKRIGTKIRHKRDSHRRSDLLSLKNFRFTQKCIAASNQNDSEEEIQKKVLFFNGNKIEGGWKNNEMHGFMVIDYVTGEHFQGRYNEGVRINGLLRFKDGSQFQGNFLNQRFHGHGRLTDPSKRKVTCEWNQGIPARRGKIQYPSGDVYYGEIQNLKKHGQGYIFFKNGQKFFGSFNQGVIEGFGKLYKGDQKIAEGNWKNGILQISEFVKIILSHTFTQLTEVGIKTEMDSKQFQVKKIPQI